jgi:hypothetical protein
MDVKEHPMPDAQGKCKICGQDMEERSGKEEMGTRKKS